MRSEGYILGVQVGILEVGGVHFGFLEVSKFGGGYILAIFGEGYIWRGLRGGGYIIGTSVGVHLAGGPARGTLFCKKVGGGYIITKSSSVSRDPLLLVNNERVFSVYFSK